MDAGDGRAGRRGAALIFAMVSTARSVAYTALALPSFFRHTPLAPGDEVLLIVNDPGGRPDLDAPGIDRARLDVVENPAPLSFAANANAALRRAAARGCGLVFMNNDIVFTPGWLGPVVADEGAITLPTCNQQRQYARSGLDLTFLMSLADFGGRHAALEAVAADHAAVEAGTPWHRALIMPFFCVHVPRRVYEAVGHFDEGFGSGGARTSTIACARCWPGSTSATPTRPTCCTSWGGRPGVRASPRPRPPPATSTTAAGSWRIGASRCARCC